MDNFGEALEQYMIALAVAAFIGGIGVCAIAVLIFQHLRNPA